MGSAVGVRHTAVLQLYGIWVVCPLVVCGVLWYVKCAVMLGVCGLVSQDMDGGRGIGMGFSVGASVCIHVFVVPAYPVRSRVCYLQRFARSTTAGCD